MKNIYIVAQEFQTPGNCGALARVMKNFNLQNLIFLNPKCNHLAKESLDRATHAKGILKKSKVIKSFKELIKKFDYVIGTTAMVGKDYNISRNPLTPEEFSQKVNKKNKFAIIIGREGEGLNNEELKMCDFTITIPSSKKYPTLNVSHAASIIFYELFKHSKDKKVAEHIKSASGKEKEVLLSLIHEAIENMGFRTEDNKKTQKAIWKRIIGKSMMNKREVFGLCGFFRKIR